MRVVFMLIFSCILFSQEKQKSVERGKALYEDLCLRCHLPNGKGIEGIYPPLAKADFLFKNLKESIISVKNGGIDGDIIVNGIEYNSYMQDMGLYNDEVADVMNYILNSWGNKFEKIITEKYVEELINTK